MHSRIFQIESEPVPKDDRLCESLVPEWFIHSIADYVADIDVNNRESEIEWLMESNFGKICRRDGDKLTFNLYIGSFFDDSYKRFKKALVDLSATNFNQFTSYGCKNGIEHLVYELNSAYKDRYGFYVWQDNELYEMDMWMRMVKPCGVYYLGGVVDYHF